MPTPSPGKCRGSVVRQLSLQSPIPSPTSHRRLKKQFSEDDTRSLEPVEITGQGWTSITERSLNNTEGKMGQKIAGTRPKPVRVAWADRKLEPSETSGVEVIAKKCQGQPRPMSVKSQRLRSPLLGNKDTLVYTRLQLAERLRNAWSEREKMKPNLNIFLAHSRNQEPNNGSSTDRQPNDDILPDAASTMSETSVPLDKKRKSMPVRAFSQDFTNPELLGTKIDFRLKLRENFYKPEPKEQEEKEVEPANEDKSTRHLQELNKIEIRVTKPDDDKEPSPKLNPSGDESPVGGKRCRNKENIKSESVDEEVKPKQVGPRTGGTAQDRRADFRRSSAVNKTITESFRSEDKVTDESENTKPAVTKPSKKPPLVRAFSAPTPNSEQSSNPSKPSKPVKVSPPRRLQPAVSFDTSNMSIDDITALRERIKSAPVRRKLKSAAARRKNKDKPGDSSEDEKERKETTKKMTKRSQNSKHGGEIVTMVSLVSPAASDTEDSVITLPMESLTRENKEEVVQTTSLLSLEKPKDSSAFVVEKFVSLRKTPKTVTFQSHPVLNRSYSASFPSRRAPAGTPIIIPTPVISNPALTPAQIQERDKRPPIFSSITSAGAEGRGIKRRLLRSFSEHPKEEEPLTETSKTPSRGSVIEATSSDVGGEDKDKERNEEEEEGETTKTNGEPEFKSAKERECWNLYQKMLEKGVSVSFDTVLRGMLTPTEYRLRKNQLLSSC